MNKKIIILIVFYILIVLTTIGWSQNPDEYMPPEPLYYAVHVQGMNGTDSESFTTTSPYTYYWCHNGWYKVLNSGYADGISIFTISNTGVYSIFELEDLNDFIGVFQYGRGYNITFQPNTNYTISLCVSSPLPKISYFYDNHGCISNR